MRARRLASIAAWINANSAALNLRAETRSVKVSTDRHISGTRLRWPGKGRRGVEISVYLVRGGEKTSWGAPLPIFTHNSGETYRRNEEVERWLSQYISKMTPKKRRGLKS